MTRHGQKLWTLMVRSQALSLLAATSVATLVATGCSGTRVLQPSPGKFAMSQGDLGAEVHFARCDSRTFLVAGPPEIVVDSDGKTLWAVRWRANHGSTGNAGSLEPYRALTYAIPWITLGQVPYSPPYDEVVPWSEPRKGSQVSVVAHTATKDYRGSFTAGELPALPNVLVDGRVQTLEKFNTDECG